MSYSNQDSPILQNHSKYKGMVRVLPTAPPNALLSLRKSGGQFASTPDLSLANSRQLQHNPPVATSSHSPVPRLPPPPKSPRPKVALQNTNNPPKMGNGQIQSVDTSTFPGSPVKFPPTKQPIIPPRQSPDFTQVKQIANTNGGGVDTRKLHDEMAQLKLELAAMNEQMREDDVWLKRQSEQVQELAQQQKQLQNDMNSISLPQNNQVSRDKVSPPPLPKSPRPTSQLLHRPPFTTEKPPSIGPKPTPPLIILPPVDTQVKRISEIDDIRKPIMKNANTGVKELVNESKERFDRDRETVVSKLSRPMSSPETRKSMGEYEKTEQTNFVSKNSSPSIDRNEIKRSPSVNVKRMSGIFESNSVIAGNHNTYMSSESTRKRQSCGPSISEKLQLFLPSLQMRTPSTATQIEKASTPEKLPAHGFIHRDDRELKPANIPNPLGSINSTKVKEPISDNHPANPTLRPPPLPTSPKPNHVYATSHTSFQMHPSANASEIHVQTRMAHQESPLQAKPLVNSTPFSSTHELQDTHSKSKAPSTPPSPPPFPSSYSPQPEIHVSPALQSQTPSIYNLPPEPHQIQPSPLPSAPSSAPPPSPIPSSEPRQTYVAPPPQTSPQPLSPIPPSEPRQTYAATPPESFPQPTSNSNSEPQTTPASPSFSTEQTSFPTPTPEAPEMHVTPNSPTLSNNNDDSLSISSLSSTSSYSIKTRSIRSDSSDGSAFKVDLMEQIRQFGKSGQVLKRAASEEADDNRSRVRKSSMHTALESRLQAFCGTNSDSGEGESDYEDDDSDNWED